MTPCKPTGLKKHKNLHLPSLSPCATRTVGDGSTSCGSSTYFAGGVVATRSAPLVTVYSRYEWLYLYRFVRPSTGENFWLILPTVSLAAMTVALQEFATYLTLDRSINLLLDRAPYHTSARLPVPSSMRLLYLPPYSPELQPAEHLWALADAPLINQNFASLDALETVLVERCRWLQDQPDIVRSTTLFHWWPDYA